MFGKLSRKARLSVLDPLHRGQGDGELAIAESADSNSRDCSQPFEHPKSAFFHDNGWPDKCETAAQL